MNHAFVIDASVALKWLIQEEFTGQAVALLQDSRRSKRPLYSPPVLTNEVTNALYQQLRRRSISQEEAEEALEQFFGWPTVQIVSLPGLYQRAFAFARNHQLPDIYDSLYIVLAQMLNAELWTDDRRLIQGIGSSTPWVRWIRDYSS